MQPLRWYLVLGAGVLCGCGRYGDFRLPVFSASSTAPALLVWQARPAPVITRADTGAWDAGDVLNPSVVRFHNTYLNLYSGFDGKTWHTGLATSADGIAWRKEGKMLSPDPATWEGDYIAANGAAIARGDSLLYFYQGGRMPQIGLAKSTDGRRWSKNGGPVLSGGPRGSWDERGVADPYVIEAGGKLYLYYLGQDRARRQRIGVAESSDGGAHWTKLRSNPVLEMGEYGEFDENGVGEPAVWTARGAYWMLYTGRDRNENRRMGLARSSDGVNWQKTKQVIAGDQAWNAKVICDATVMAAAEGFQVWFGGGDVARPDENIHGQIGFAILKP